MRRRRRRSAAAAEEVGVGVGEGGREGGREGVTIVTGERGGNIGGMGGGREGGIITIGMISMEEGEGGRETVVAMIALILLRGMVGTMEELEEEEEGGREEGGEEEEGTSNMAQAVVVMVGMEVEVGEGIETRGGSSSRPCTTSSSSS